MKAGRELTCLFAAAALALSACGSPPAPSGETQTEAAQAALESRTERNQAPESGAEPGMESGAGEDAGFHGKTGEYEPPDGASGPEPTSAPEAEMPLTVEKVLELSGREDLTWEDFREYPSEEVGSGLYILRYDIDDEFRLLIGGGGPDQPPMYIRAASVWDQEAYIDIRNPVQEVRAFFQEHGQTDEYVGIRGHVKEVGEDRVLISSDTDDFPGAFWVADVQALTAEGELKGGTPVFVLMEDRGEEADGLELFRAKQIMALSDEGEEGKADILLTEPPALALIDVLSSKYEDFELWPGNFTWSTMEGGEAKTVVACGAAPLSSQYLERTDRLKIPAYNGPDQTSYRLSMTAAPDRLVVRRWNEADADKEGGAPECVITYYCPVFTVGLEKGKVYEFEAEWKEENLEQDGYAGKASYVLVTE